MKETKKNPMPEEPAQRPVEASVLFQSAHLHNLGPGLWKYRHEGDMPACLPPAFWTRPVRDYGMKSGDVVLLVAGKTASLVVV